jgi:hypothetical protein
VRWLDTALVKRGLPRLKRKVIQKCVSEVYLSKGLFKRGKPRFTRAVASYSTPEHTLKPYLAMLRHSSNHKTALILLAEGDPNILFF